MEETAKQDKDQHVTLECVRCHKKFANLTWGYEQPVDPHDVKLIDSDKVLKEGDELRCTFCSAPFTNWDLILAIAARMEINNESKEVPIQGPGDPTTGQL